MRNFKRALTLFLVFAMLAGFMVPVAAETYDSISLNETVSVEATTTLAFVPETDGLYIFSSANYDHDPSCYVYDSNFNSLVWNDDDGEEWNFQAYWFGKAGQTYYLEAGGFGKYDVTVTLADLQNIGLNETALVETPSKYFTFTPEVDGLYAFASSDCDGDPVGKMYDPIDEKRLFDNDSGGDGNFKVLLPAVAGRTYYLEAAGYGSYQVSVTLANLPDLILGTSVTVDEGSRYFKFVPEKDGLYTIATENATSYYEVDLYDETMSIIDGVWSEEGEPRQVDVALKAGKTYILAAFGGDPYQVKLTRSSQISVGDTLMLEKGVMREFVPETTGLYFLTLSNCEDFGWMAFCDTALNSLGDGTYVDENGNYVTSLMARAGETYFVVVSAYSSCQLTLTQQEIPSIGFEEIVAVTPTQMFKFVPETSGCYAFTSYDYTGDPRACVYDADMNALVMDDDSGEDWNFQASWYAEAGKTYYLEAAGHGTYQVSVVTQDVATDMFLDEGIIVGDPLIVHTASLYCNFVPSNAYGGVITWTSSDETIATVDEYGNVDILGYGTAVITATSSLGMEATCQVISRDIKPMSVDAPVTIDGGDIFAFTPAEDGLYCFSSQGNMDTYVILYDEDGGFLDSNDDSHLGMNFSLNYEMTAGKTYYLMARLAGSQFREGTFQFQANKVVPATGMELSQTEIVGKLGYMTTLTATFMPAGAMYEPITWDSSDWTVAEVSSDGTVCLVGYGTAVITATSESGLTATCTVKTPMPEYQQLQCGQSVLVMETEEDTWFSFTPETTGWYRFYTEGESADPCGALKDQFGETLATADDNWDHMNFALSYEMIAGETYYLRLTFYSDGGDDACTVHLEQMTMPTGITLSYSTMKGYLGQELYLEAVVAPDNAVDQLIWTSSDESIATVGEGGYVYLSDYGTVTITATTINGLEAKCQITVEEPQTIQLGVGAVADINNSENRFWFVPEEDGWYGVYSVSDLDTVGMVQDANGDYICDDDDSGREYNFLMRCALKAGTPYLIRTGLYSNNFSDEQTYMVYVEKLQPAQGMTAPYEKITVYAGSPLYLQCDFLPIASHPENVTWTSSDPDVVQNLENGEFYANKAGTAVLTATSDSGLTDSMTIVVVAVPEVAEDGGNCGENLLWYLHDGVITVMGSGDMFDSFEFYCDFEQVELPEGLTGIAALMFLERDLETITIPASVQKIGAHAFGLSDIKEIRFQGSAPEIAENAFENGTAVVYYPANDPTWAQVVGNQYGGNVTWIPYGAGEVTCLSITGTITTGAEGITTLELIGLESQVSQIVSGKTGTYEFEFVSPGTYTLLVSKENHVEREYTITVTSQAVIQDVEICLIGDVDGNGKINVGDISKLLSHVRGLSLLTDEYQLSCANANGGKLNMGDISTIYAHIKGTKKLF